MKNLLMLSLLVFINSFSFAQTDAEKFNMETWFSIGKDSVEASRLVYLRSNEGKLNFNGKSQNDVKCEFSVSHHVFNDTSRLPWTTLGYYVLTGSAAGIENRSAQRHFSGATFKRSFKTAWYKFPNEFFSLFSATAKLPVSVSKYGEEKKRIFGWRHASHSFNFTDKTFEENGTVYELDLAFFREDKRIPRMATITYANAKENMSMKLECPELRLDGLQASEGALGGQWYFKNGERKELYNDLELKF